MAGKQAAEELGEGEKANAEDMNFSSYGVGQERRTGVAGDGDEDLIDDDDY